MKKKQTIMENIKNPQKEINLNIGKKHLIIFLIGVVIVSLLMNIYPSWFGLYEYQFIGCTDGTILPVVSNQTIYCGQNISELGYTMVEGVWQK